MIIYPINFFNLSIFAQNVSSNDSTNSSQNDKTTDLLSTSVPRDQKAFTYYFPYQTDGQNTKISVSLISKKGDAFDFIPNESVIFFISSSDFQNKQGDCKSSTAKRKKLTDKGTLTDNRFNGNFDSKNLTNYSFPFGEISSLGENIGCIGMKIKIAENAQAGDESQIIFTNILDPKLDNNLQKLIQIGTLKIVEKNTSANNSVNSTNSQNFSSNSQNNDSKLLDNDLKPPNSCLDLSDSTKNSPNYDNTAPCLPQIPGTQTKTRYSGQSFEFRYNENTKKYDTIIRKKIDYKDSVDQVGCYNLKELNLDTFGCSQFLEDQIELYTVNYSFIFPISQRNEFQNFYQNQGFRLSQQSSGVQWQVEYYRFKDSGGNFGAWKSYVADIYHQKPTNYPKLVDPKEAQWIKYEINSSSPLINSPIKYEIKNSDPIVDL